MLNELIKQFGAGVVKTTSAALGLIALIVVSTQLFEIQDANEYMVIQNPFTGSVNVYTTPGPHLQLMGSVTKFPIRNEYVFGEIKLDEKTNRKSCIGGLGIRFYDGGHADVCGAVSWVMPSDEKSLHNIYVAFKSTSAIESSAIARAMSSAAYFSGPTMSSLESAEGRRTELLQYINDQMINGVYKTNAKTVERVDESGIKHSNTITEILIGKDGQPLRAQSSFVKAFNIQLLPLTITAFSYDDKVEKQIVDQQQATNAVQVAIANAKRAEQDAKTAAAQGERDAVTAKWKQETINAKAIAEAEAKVVIAEAEVKAAEASKRAKILMGEGEARAKQLVMEADGALEKKIEAYVTVNKNYADAIAKYQGAWVPGVVMGNGSTSANGANQLVEMLTAQTARQLSLDVGMKKGK